MVRAAEQREPPFAAQQSPSELIAPTKFDTTHQHRQRFVAAASPSLALDERLARNGPELWHAVLDAMGGERAR